MKRPGLHGVLVAQTFWHSSSHVLGEALEAEFGVDLTIGPAIEEGFYYDCYMGDRALGEPEKERLNRRIADVRNPSRPTDACQPDMAVDAGPCSLPSWRCGSTQISIWACAQAAFWLLGPLSLGLHVYVVATQYP